ncbi:MAG: hypothetical protein JJV95_01370 [Sulfurospirillum sp.]|nr:hypothetical protein [Sulfurospirillum sp.]MBL0702620.1 hypothetical protein [Sulfurospirillum sp.]
MQRLILILFFSLLFIGCSTHVKKKYHEKHYQTILCTKLNGEMEYVLKDRTRVDCLTDEYAIEVDFAKKWAEGIGQSLYYAHMTNKKPAVGFIMNTKKDKRYLKRLNTIAKEYGIKIFIIEKED